MNEQTDPPQKEESPLSSMQEHLLHRSLLAHEKEIDFLKHVVTLSTGSILLMATLLDRFSEQPNSTWLVVFSLISFGVSIMGTLCMHFWSLLRLSSLPENFTAGQMRGYRALCFLSFGGFFGGLASLIIFGALNIL